MGQNTASHQWLVRDFQRVLILIVAAVAVVFVTPFGIFRFLNGYYLVALLDAVIVATATGSAIYVWITGKTRLGGILVTVVITVAGGLVSYLVGLDGAVWIFPVILFAFYLSPPRLALTLTFLCLGSVAAIEMFEARSIFASTNQMASFLVSGVAGIVFSFVFSQRSSAQRAELVLLATKDPLTNLYNRRTLEDELESILSARDRYNRAYGMLVLDLDHFKALNDREGHQAGDRVLREVANLITDAIRRSDRAFRYGGDEFVILLPDADPAGLRRVAETLISQAQERLHTNNPLTLSAGGALLRPEDDKDSWNRRADRCLYAAKEAGRSRVVLEGE